MIPYDAGHYIKLDELLESVGRRGALIWIYPTPLWMWAHYD